MHGVLELPPGLEHVGSLVRERLARVTQRFNEQIRSELPAVVALTADAEQYRGKMLRPTLVLLCGLAAHPRAARVPAEALTQHHDTAAAVCEMVHMATLVHDDVLDEADLRRGTHTINRLHGNEAAVILGDFLIASAYHLCSQLAPAPLARDAALAVGRASMVMCEGELLQLHHRGDCSLDEPTYFEILERKTAELIATSARLGALVSGADEHTAATLERFGRDLGVAFQIQDDLLDLTAEARTIGKPVGKDLEKGKLTLPTIHCLSTSDPRTRGRVLAMLRAAGERDHATRSVVHDLAVILEITGSFAYARDRAAGLVRAAQDSLRGLPASPARDALHALADAVIARQR